MLSLDFNLAGDSDLMDLNSQYLDLFFEILEENHSELLTENNINLDLYKDKLLKIQIRLEKDESVKQYCWCDEIKKQK